MTTRRPLARSRPDVLPVRVHPEDPHRVEVLWDQVETRSSKVLRTVEDRLDRVDLASLAAPPSHNATSDLDAIAARGYQGRPDPKQALLQHWAIADPAMRRILEPQMRALGVEPPTEG